MCQTFILMGVTTNLPFGSIKIMKRFRSQLHSSWTTDSYNGDIFSQLKTFYFNSTHTVVFQYLIRLQSINIRFNVSLLSSKFHKRKWLQKCIAALNLLICYLVFSIWSVLLKANSGTTSSFRSFLSFALLQFKRSSKSTTAVSFVMGDEISLPAPIISIAKGFSRNKNEPDLF